jgi:hypothetical protein
MVVCLIKARHYTFRASEVDALFYKIVKTRAMPVPSLSMSLKLRKTDSPERRRRTCVASEQHYRELVRRNGNTLRGKW